MSVARENKKQSLIRKINDIQKTPDNLLDPKKVAALNTQLEQSRRLFFNDNQTLNQLQTTLEGLSKRAIPVAEKMRDAKQTLEEQEKERLIKKKQFTDQIEQLQFEPPFSFVSKEEMLDDLYDEIYEKKSIVGSQNELTRLFKIVEKTRQRVQTYKDTLMAEDQTFAIGDSDLKEK